MKAKTRQRTSNELGGRTTEPKIKQESSTIASGKNETRCQLEEDQDADFEAQYVDRIPGDVDVGDGIDLEDGVGFQTWDQWRQRIDPEDELSEEEFEAMRRRTVRQERVRKWVLRLPNLENA